VCKDAGRATKIFARLASATPGGTVKPSIDNARSFQHEPHPFLSIGVVIRFVSGAIARLAGLGAALVVLLSIPISAVQAASTAARPLHQIPTVAMAGTILLGIMAIWALAKAGNKTLECIPGPPGLPLLGNTFELLKDPSNMHKILHSWAGALIFQCCPAEHVC